MQKTPASDPTPPDCFRLAELQALQAAENRVLADVNYYLWTNRTEAGAAPYRFLYGLELLFEQGEGLLLSSGEDTEALQVIDAEALVKTARRLQTLHARISMQRVNAGAFPLWEPAVGQRLEAVCLSKNEQGLYWNDALLLDFGVRQILVGLSQKEGLEIGLYPPSGK